MKKFVLLFVVMLLVVPWAVMAQDDVTFVSTQFNNVEEGERFDTILEEAGLPSFTRMEGTPLTAQLIAEADGTEIDVVGALHGSFPTMAQEGVLMNLIDVLEDLEADREFAPAFVELGLLGSDDYIYYIPWMQATYIFAAHNDALMYLPEGADINALTWEELGVWCQALAEGTGSNKCGFPHAGLFHRFLEGYLFPSFTGGMVSEFRSEAAVEMFEWVKADLWPYVHEQSITYDFMQDPLLAGDVWVAFDHTARLIDAFNEKPDEFVAFPAPAGPAGRGFMPVVVGLGIPEAADDADAGAAVIEYLTQPQVQINVLAELGFFPVVGGDVDISALPEGVALEVAAVTAQANSEDALPALLPVGLGDRGGEINDIFKDAFNRIVLDGEDIETVLQEQGDLLQSLMDDTGAPCWAPDPAGDGPCQVN